MNSPLHPIDALVVSPDAWCAAPTAEPPRPRYGVKSWGEMHRVIPTASQRNRNAKSREALAHRKAVKKHKAAMRRAGKR